MTLSNFVRVIVLVLSTANVLGFSVVGLLRTGPHHLGSANRKLSAPMPLRQNFPACAALRIATPLFKVEGYEAIRDILGGLPITGGYASISDLFNKFDKDLSGKIEPVELQQTLREMGVALTDSQVSISTILIYRIDLIKSVRISTFLIYGICLIQSVYAGVRISPCAHSRWWRCVLVRLSKCDRAD
jgi:hypothetical protein